ncbi:MAG: multiheme c-type cytochrome [Verrucomicrobiota bacterium]
MIYSADLRGHIAPRTPDADGGLARRATTVDRIKLEGGTVVQVDAGDLLATATDSGDGDGPPPIYDRERRPMIVLTSLNRMGVDAVTLGERDLALGADRLRSVIKAAKLSVVAANLFELGGEKLFPADRLIDAAGTSVGIFGVLDLPAQATADLRRHGLIVGDAVEAAREAARSLRTRGARLVVGLFHLAAGGARLEQILAGLDADAAVDVAVLGHDDGEPAVATIGRTRVVRAHGLGADVGRLDVRGLAPGAQTTFVDGKSTLTKGIPDHAGVALVERAEIERVLTARDQAAAALRRKKRQPEPTVFEDWTYASNDACIGCHQSQVAQWKTTDHAQALATLQRSKHDRDPACLGCHMTGYLLPGGTRKLETANRFFANVGCESCHGPSAAHVRSTDKKRGMSRTVDPLVCLGCHTSDQNIGPFDYAAGLKAIVGPGHGMPPTPPPKLEPLGIGGGDASGAPDSPPR